MTEDRLSFSSRPQWVAGALFYAVLALAFLVYWPGLSGTYLFDDYPNLAALDRITSNPTLDQFVQFLVHGISSPTGRPVSLLSFALQAYDWPEDPRAFIFVNLLLHALNGALLFWWLLRLTRLMGLPPRAGLFIPLASTALWLVTPLQATAVLYIVQRMTELSATFVFLGMLLYVVGRQRAAVSERAGLAWMTAGLAVGCGIGTLAKENAILMPLLVLVLEATLLAPIAKPARWRPWAALFLAVPLLALAAYLVAGPTLGAYASREFTLEQRLMTEARALWMYLYKLLVPWPSGIRLLYDDYPLSTGLLQPWTTLPAVLGVAGLLAGAWRVRRRFPVVAFAILWFFAAHVLESSVIPLELVFEHRNYQASVGILFAIAVGPVHLWTRASGPPMRFALTGLAAAYLALLSLVTVQISTLWGRPLELVTWWATRLPDSTRARIDLLSALMLRGLNAKAVEVAEDASAHWPDDPSFQTITLQLACQHADIAPPPQPDIVARTRRVDSEVLTVVNLFDGVLTLMERDHCPHVAPAVIREIVEAAFDNPAAQFHRQNLLFMQARALKLEGRFPEARARFREAIEIRPQMILLIQAVLDELEAGNLDEARRFLQRAESEPRISRVDRWSHRQDIEDLKKLVALYEGAPPAPPP